jgi:hypothetical protein
MGRWLITDRKKDEKSIFNYGNIMYWNYSS